MPLRNLTLSKSEKDQLRRKFLTTAEVVPLASDPKFFSLVVALGIHQEIGTIHDEFSVFLFDGETGLKIPREDLRSELVEYNGYTGVRIWAEGHARLDSRVRGMRTLLHPKFSFREDGSIFQCVFFPEIITKIAALEGVELVSVKSWGINTVFGGFDPKKSYYEGSMWEFVNLDAIKYSHLLEKKQIVFWGTHDLVSHVAGLERSAWPELQERGRNARQLFENYFAGVTRPVAQTLVLPYALGMLMDDLAQPMNYGSNSRRHVADLLTRAIADKRVTPRSQAYLLKYPPSFDKLIALARADDLEQTQFKSDALVNELVGELHSFAAAI